MRGIANSFIGCKISQYYYPQAQKLPMNLENMGVGSRTARGDSLGDSDGRIPLVKIIAHVGGLSPPRFLYQSCLSTHIDLASNVLYGIAKMDLHTTI